jgi:hypothetical protein
MNVNIVVDSLAGESAELITLIANSLLPKVTQSQIFIITKK